MPSSNCQEIDRNKELVALARLLIYALEAAKGIKAIEVEASLAVTLESIAKELTGDICADVKAIQQSPVAQSQNFH